MGANGYGDSFPARTEIGSGYCGLVPPVSGSLTAGGSPRYVLVEVSAFLWFLLFPQLVSSSPCTDAVERQLEAWNATPEVLKAPGGPLGGAVYRIATNEIGVWVTVHRPRGLDIVSLFLTNADGTVRLDFVETREETCEPEPTTSLPAVKLPADAFTDEDLKELLAGDDRLVVYLWSPHLPLSVEGYHEIVHATSSISVPLVAVADGTAESGFVQRVADAYGIPDESRRPMRSVELLFRDLAVHTPSLVVFSGGHVSAPLPGYRNRAAYRVYLETIFRTRSENVGHGSTARRCRKKNTAEHAEKSKKKTQRRQAAKTQRENQRRRRFKAD